MIMLQGRIDIHHHVIPPAFIEAMTNEKLSRSGPRGTRSASCRCYASSPILDASQYWRISSSLSLGILISQPDANSTSSGTSRPSRSDQKFP